MKWIKASERLPDKSGLYFIKRTDLIRDVALYDLDTGSFYYPLHLEQKYRKDIEEWLNESQASDKDKEMLAEVNLKAYDKLWNEKEDFNKEIERLKELISKAHRRGFNAGSPHKHYETEKENSAWQLFKSENNL